MTQNSINVTATTGAPIRVNVTASGSQGAVTLSQDTSAYNAEIARQWAISDKMVLQEDYSSKYYAGKAKESENASKNYATVVEGVYNDIQDSANDVLDNIETNKNSAIEEIETIKTNAVNTANEANTTINTNKTNAINEINTTKNSAVSSVNTTKTSAITEINNTKTTAVNAVNTSKNQALNDIEKESSSIVNFKEEVNAELETKVDLEDMVAFDMKEVPCVVETYVNGTSWYRVYSDGWCEQGGKTSQQAHSGITINLLKPYANANYTITISTQNLTSNVHTTNVSNITASAFKVTSNYGGTDSTGIVAWMTSGYIA